MSDALLMNETTGNPNEITPIQAIGGIWLKRDELFSFAGVRGGKARTCLTLASHAKLGLITASARQSPQSNIVSAIARSLGLACRVHTAAGSKTPELEQAEALGAEIVYHSPGYNRVIIARAREDVARRNWTMIPFGMECVQAIESAAQQTGNLPAEAKRLVVPVGSGLTLAGIATGLSRSRQSIPILGVVIGADPGKRLKKWISASWKPQINLVCAREPYHRVAKETDFNGIPLDPIYEAKCVPFLRRGDCFWIVGIRGGATA